MPTRSSGRGLKVGSKVWVNIDQSRADLLEDMGLVGENGNILQGIRMQGTVQSKTKNTYTVYLDAACETFGFVKEKTYPLKDLTPPPSYHVVVNDAIVVVRGLVFSQDNRPATYHLTEEQAEVELEATTAASASASEKNTTPPASASTISPPGNVYIDLHMHKSLP